MLSGRLISRSRPFGKSPDVHLQTDLAESGGCVVSRLESYHASHLRWVGHHVLRAGTDVWIVLHQLDTFQTFRNCGQYCLTSIADGARGQPIEHGYDPWVLNQRQFHSRSS